MLQLLAPSETSRVGPLFAPLSEYRLLPSVMAGITRAPVYVDDPVCPTSAVVLFHHKIILAGNSQNQGFNRDLTNLLAEEVFPAARQAGPKLFVVFPSDPAWRIQFPILFGDAFSRQIPSVREYYRWRSGQNRLPAGWRELLPPGGILRSVDAALLEQRELQNFETLAEETQSERHSIDDFLAHSFGVALVIGDCLAAWCLSEYNLDSSCEVGIATVEDYQLRGFGTFVGAAMLEEALARGYSEIGWDCWQWNEASRRLARKLGYELLREREVTICLFE